MTKKEMCRSFICLVYELDWYYAKRNDGVIDRTCRANYYFRLGRAYELWLALGSEYRYLHCHEDSLRFYEKHLEPFFNGVTI